MKTRSLLLLLLLMTATYLSAEELGTLFINLTDGSKVQIILPTQKPTINCQNSVMTVAYLSDANTSDTLTFSRDDVESLKIGTTFVDAIADSKKEADNSIRFDLTRPGVIIVSGLTKNDRLQVFDLKGKRTKATITRNENRATVDLTSLHRGVYLVSVNQRFTFKMMKP